MAKQAPSQLRQKCWRKRQGKMHKSLKVYTLSGIDTKLSGWTLTNIQSTWIELTLDERQFRVDMYK